MIPQLENLADIISGFPGVGKKSAMRIAFYLLGRPQEYIRDFIATLENFHSTIEFCEVCGALKEVDSGCHYCDNTRDQATLCVVEQPSDLYAIEKTGDYKGSYHVLMGSLSPLDGVGPEDIRLKELFHRIQTGNISEVIVATNPSVEGNATAHYIARHLNQTDNTNRTAPSVTRIASGMAMGSQLEYTDARVISQSIRSRTLIDPDER